ncbi:MAG: hypothetical protein V4713_03930 [Pseudomonadota bacterium]
MATATISEKNLRAFRAAVKKLDAVIADCRKENPACKAYLDGNQNFCLMDGSKSIGEEGDQETILAEGRLAAHAGDW